MYPALSLLRPGTTLGRYELLCPVAMGGMASVWAARLKGTRGFQKVFAVKTLLPALSDDPTFETMFLDEANLAAQVHHPNMVEIIELGEERGLLYMVMEWINGDTLASLLKAAAQKKVSVPIPVAVRIAMQVCAVLHVAHELQDPTGKHIGLIHRDVSPQNVMITFQGAVKVVDFGVAKATGRTSKPTSAGEVKGKPNYMAPEQIRGFEIDRRVDVFALGILLYQMTTGRHPFQAANSVATVQQIISDGPAPSPSKNFVAGYPEALEAVVMKALSKKAEDRYATTNEMMRELDRALTGELRACTDEDVARLVNQLLPGRKSEVDAMIASALREAEERSDVSIPAAHAAKAEQKAKSVEADRAAAEKLADEKVKAAWQARPIPISEPPPRGAPRPGAVKVTMPLGTAVAPDVKAAAAKAAAPAPTPAQTATTEPPPRPLNRPPSPSTADRETVPAPVPPSEPTKPEAAPAPATPAAAAAPAAPKPALAPKPASPPPARKMTLLGVAPAPAMVEAPSADKAPPAHKAPDGSHAGPGLAPPARAPSADKAPAAGPSHGPATAESKPTDPPSPDKPSHDKPSPDRQQAPADKALAAADGKGPAEPPSADKAPSDKALADKAPSDKAPADKAPADNPVAGSKPEAPPAAQAPSPSLTEVPWEVEPLPEPGVAAPRAPEKAAKPDDAPAATAPAAASPAGPPVPPPPVAPPFATSPTTTTFDPPPVQANDPAAPTAEDSLLAEWEAEEPPAKRVSFDDEGSIPPPSAEEEARRTRLRKVVGGVVGASALLVVGGILLSSLKGGDSSSNSSTAATSKPTSTSAATTTTATATTTATTADTAPPAASASDPPPKPTAEPPADSTGKPADTAPVASARPADTAPTKAAGAVTQPASGPKPQGGPTKKGKGGSPVRSSGLLSEHRRGAVG